MQQVGGRAGGREVVRCEVWWIEAEREYIYMVEKREERRER